MTKRKAPKRGRPEGDETTTKTAQISVRIPRDLRAELEREAKRNRQSLSREIQNRLAQSLVEKKRLHHESDQTSWLGFLARKLAHGCETSTGKPWPKDTFTFDALTAALSMSLAELRPEGEPVIPDRIKADIEKKPLYDQFKTPEGLAAAIVLGLLDQIKTTPPAPVGAPKNQHYSDTFYWGPRFREAFGISPTGPAKAIRDRETEK